MMSSFVSRTFNIRLFSEDQRVNSLPLPVRCVISVRDEPNHDGSSNLLDDDVG